MNFFKKLYKLRSCIRFYNRIVSSLCKILSSASYYCFPYILVYFFFFFYFLLFVLFCLCFFIYDIFLCCFLTHFLFYFFFVLFIYFIFILSFIYIFFAHKNKIQLLMMFIILVNSINLLIS